MVGTLMLTKLEAEPEGLPAHITHVGLLPRMDRLMDDAVGAEAEAFATLHTSEGLVPGMASLMAD